MIGKENYPTPEIQDDVINEGIKLQPTGYSQEGNNSIYNFTLAVNTDQQLLLKQNLQRKRLTIQNTSPSNKVQISRTVIVNGQNSQQYITILAGASVLFDVISRGKFVQCINGSEIQQEILQCEYIGPLLMNNPNATVSTVEIFESV